ncbi:MAG: OB-fold nucleic acid binding domain-containing protein [Gordonia sp. (in: high G+C Gram-positive bacteria)]|uniref:OB-fold nucleic acid binding domain-containing protein n=1 Tax=Gordonia sp. (in: high G+C Gram-positive bacteria) TaxID=84139 RepID=UPI0039E70EF0
MGSPGLMKRLGRLLTEDLETLDDDRIERACRVAGGQRAKDCRRGDEAVLMGELRSVQTCTRSALRQQSGTRGGGVVAELFDGSDTVLLKWLGRSRIPGIEPGRRITVRGRVATVDGMKIIYNPYYELHSTQE